MSEPKKLPKSFWILISLVLIVTVILLVGIGVENKDIFKNLFANFNWFQNRSKSFPQISQCKILKEDTFGLNTKMQLDFWDSETMNVWAHSKDKVHLFKYSDQGNNKVDLQQVAEWSVPCASKECEVNSFKRIYADLFMVHIKDAKVHKSIPFQIERTKGEIAKAEFKLSLGICGQSWSSSAEFFRDTQFKEQFYVLDPEQKVLGIYRGLRLSAYSQMEIPVSPRNTYKVDSGFMTPFQCEPSQKQKAFRKVHFNQNHLYILPESRQAGQYEMWMLKMLGDYLQGPDRIPGEVFNKGVLTSMDGQDALMVVSSETDSGKNKMNILYSVAGAKLNRVAELSDFQNLQFAQVKSDASSTTSDKSKVILFEQKVSDPHLLYYYNSGQRQKWIELLRLNSKKISGEQVLVVPLGMSRFQILYNQKMSYEISFAAVDCDAALLE